MPENKHPLPVPKPPQIPKDARIKRIAKKRPEGGELLSISKWTLKKLEEKHDGDVEENEDNEQG